MELSEFVEETLNQILEGVNAAKKKEGGSAVAAPATLSAPQQGLVSATQGIFTVVQFDVSGSQRTRLAERLVCAFGLWEEEYLGSMLHSTPTT